jgi:hypothetical protein
MAQNKKATFRRKSNLCCLWSIKSLEVHHIEPVHLNPDRELDPSNLITLCSDPCHIVFGHFMDYKSWNINVVKDCSVYYNKCTLKPKNSG